MGLRDLVRRLLGRDVPGPDNPAERVCPIGRCDMTRHEADAGVFCLCKDPTRAFGTPVGAGCFEFSGRTENNKRRYRMNRTVGRVVSSAAMKRLSRGPGPRSEE